MKYNEETNRYELEDSDIDENPYKDSTELLRALKRQSRSLYQWIYSQINPVNREIVEKALRKDPAYVSAVKEALVDCYEADVEVGFNDLKYQFGDNVSYIDEVQMVSKLVPMTAKLILQSVRGSVNIFFSGVITRSGEVL